MEIIDLEISPMVGTPIISTLQDPDGIPCHLSNSPPLSNSLCRIPICVVVLVAKVQVAQPCGVHAFVCVLPKYTQDFQARHIPPQTMKEAMERQRSKARHDTFKGWILT